ncbi:cell division ATPase MinD [Candidatus Woesearchaeota archaeon]|nr:cell division ATPase MinD [Candidatus Woesearchaeota archaeon]
MARYICVIGGKGGVGKTTSAISLAHAMGKHKKTLLVDANLSTPNAHIHLGSPMLKKSLMNALKGEISVQEAIHSHDSGLRIIPTISTVRDLKMLKYDKLKQAIRELEGHAEIILLDTAAGLNREAITAIEACDEALVITNPELSAVLDSQKAIQVANELGKTILGVVVNKHGEHRSELKVNEVEKLLDLPVIGVIPYDRRVKRAQYFKHPVTYIHPESKASKSYEQLAGLLLGKSYFESTGKDKTLYHYLLRRLGLG